jgi:hypothetical protein
VLDDSDLLEFMCVYIITDRSLTYHIRTLFLKQVGSDRVRTRNDCRVRLMSPVPKKKKEEVGVKFKFIYSGHGKSPRQVFVE